MFGSYFFGQNALLALFSKKCTFPPPSDPCAPALMFSQVKSMVWGEKSELFRKKCTFCTFSTFDAKKLAPGRGCIDEFIGAGKMGELFAPKCTLGALGALGLRPGLGGSGLRAEGSELRAEGRGPRAEDRGLCWRRARR